MIWAIGSVGDETFSHSVRAFLDFGLSVRVIDQALLAHGGSFVLAHASDSWIEFCGERLVFAECASMYVRLTDIAPGAPDEASGAISRAMYYALNEFIANITAIPIANRPLGDVSNVSKILHSALWSQLGVMVPESCVTDRPDVALEFISKWNSNVIYKGASASKTWVSGFNALADLSRLTLIAKSPVLFQQRIDGPDVRVHVVGSEVFAEQINSSAIDYRTVKGRNRYTAVVLPERIAHACTQIAGSTDQPLLGIDFKVQAETGDWYFLEANAMPCYQGYDKRAKGAISRALARYLMRSSND